MALYLPLPLARRADRLLSDLLTADGAGAFDFSEPSGALALTPATSISWRVFSNPVTVFIGGVAGVLLQLAEPRVRHGVWDHTSFREYPLERLQRTGLAAMITVFAPATAARNMIEGINRLHAQVSGVTSLGEPYRADDPELLRWVHTTAAFGFVQAYSLYGGRLSRSELDAYYAECAPVAELYGALDCPMNEAERIHLFRKMLPRLLHSEVLEEFLAIMRRVRALPHAARPAQILLVRAALDVLPRDISSRLLPKHKNLQFWERSLVRALGKAAGETVLPSSPAVQSCRRLGLPDTYLYGRSPPPRVLID